VTLFELARSREGDCTLAIDRAHAFWSSLEWASEGMAYRKYVIRTSRACSSTSTKSAWTSFASRRPKTRLEADKDFWEAKRAADHLEGSVEKAMQGEIVPTMIAGQTYGRTPTSRLASAR